MHDKHADFIIFLIMAVVLLFFGIVTERYYLIIFGVVMAGFMVVSVIDIIVSAKIKIDSKKKRREKHGSIHE